MNEDLEKQILDELRKQTALQRRINTVALIVLGVFLFVFLPFEDQILAPFRHHYQVVDSWQEARSLLDQAKCEKAEEMIQRLIAKHPDFDYGYRLLGSVHQELGNLNEAEANYDKAYNLFPSEDNEKTLAAIRKALENKKTSANQASEAIGAEAAPQPQR